MLYFAGWNKVCNHKNIPYPISVGFLVELWPVVFPLLLYFNHIYSRDGLITVLKETRFY